MHGDSGLVVGGPPNAQSPPSAEDVRAQLERPRRQPRFRCPRAGPQVPALRRRGDAGRPRGPHQGLLGRDRGVRARLRTSTPRAIRSCASRPGGSAAPWSTTIWSPACPTRSSSTFPRAPMSRTLPGGPPQAAERPSCRPPPCAARCHRSLRRPRRGKSLARRGARRGPCRRRSLSWLLLWGPSRERRSHTARGTGGHAAGRADPGRHAVRQPGRGSGSQDLRRRASPRRS